MLALMLNGNLGHDARNVTNGVGFSVGVQTVQKDQKKTEWVNTFIGGKYGESLLPYLKKGTNVTVLGQLKVNEFRRRDGSNGFSLEVFAHQVTLGPKKQEQTQTVEPQVVSENQSVPTFEDLPF